MRLDPKELFESGEIKRLIICGGDGTVNHTINQLGDFLPKIEIGIIPLGYGNLIARTLDTCSSAASFVSDKQKSDIEKIDIGQANDRYFLNVASVGLTADTVSFVEKFRHHTLGSVMYRVVGGLIIHTLFFCIILLKNKTFKKHSESPSSKTWIRTKENNSEHSFSVSFGIRHLISIYKSIYMPRAPFIPWNNDSSAKSSREDLVEHKHPFSWQIDGEPQEKTRRLKITLKSRMLKIQTIKPFYN